MSNNEFEDHSYCTLCCSFVPNGTFCSDTECPVQDVETYVEDLSDDYLPVNFHEIQDSRDEEDDPQQYYDYDDVHGTHEDEDDYRT